MSGIKGILDGRATQAGNPGGRRQGEMRIITLDSETDFDGWRKATRALALNGVDPRKVAWTVRGNEPELFEAEPQAPLEEAPGGFNVPAKFVELAKIAI